MLTFQEAYQEYKDGKKTLRQAAKSANMYPFQFIQKLQDIAEKKKWGDQT